MMSEKIEIDLEKECVVILGSMNSMPMMYALELKKRGYEVIYFVDVKKSDHLSRPERHFSQINYPYPNWIVEFLIGHPILVSFFPRLYSNLINRIVKKRTNKKIKCIIAGGGFISTLLYFDVIHKVVLGYGADIEWFCNVNSINKLADEYKEKSFTKFLPYKIIKYLMSQVVFNNFNSALAANKIVYFSKGYSLKGDDVIKKLSERGG